jgi:hypothetical protein
VSDWVYVAIAFTAVWGALAFYALLLARRVTQAREVADNLRRAAEGTPPVTEQDGTACDAPPAP